MFRITRGRNGVAIVMFENAHSVLIEWKPVSDYMAYVRFKSKFCNISVINAYAPILLADYHDKDKFYELRLQIDSVLMHNMVIIERLECAHAS